MLVREWCENAARNRGSNEHCSKIAELVLNVLQHVEGALSHLFLVCWQLPQNRLVLFALGYSLQHCFYNISLATCHAPSSICVSSGTFSFCCFCLKPTAVCAKLRSAVPHAGSAKLIANCSNCCCATYFCCCNTLNSLLSPF